MQMEVQVYISPLSKVVVLESSFCTRLAVSFEDGGEVLALESTKFPESLLSTERFIV